MGQLCQGKRQAADSPFFGAYDGGQTTSGVVEACTDEAVQEGELDDEVRDEDDEGLAVLKSVEEDSEDAEDAEDVGIRRIT